MPELKEVEETQPEFDTDSAIAEISSDLFGQGEDEDGKSKLVGGEEDKSSDGPELVDAADPPPQADEIKKVEGEVVEDNSAAVQEVGAPKTWTKAALEKWATVDPVVQQEILKREDDFLQGITQYKAAADIGMAYDKVVEPYKPILAAENVDPVQMFQSFAANHYLLMKGTPQQKIELAASLINGYNIPLAELLEHIADGGDQSTQVDPQIIALKKELADIKGHFTAQDQGIRAAQQKTIEREIETFAADPAHPYFDELASDISKLFGSGLATSLEEAYEKAVYANPATRQKEIDRLTAERTSAALPKRKLVKTKKPNQQADSCDAHSEIKGRHGSCGFD
jgi:hypothetical protein